MVDIKATGMILRVSVIILTAMFHHSIVLESSVSAATQLTVLPLWDVVASNDSLSCSLAKKNSSQPDVVLIHGSALQMCSLQINTSLGYDARIEIPGSRVSTEPFSLYVERHGDLVSCKHKYVAFYRETDHADTCTSAIHQDSFQFNLHSDISISISAVLASDLHPVCPESNSDTASPKMNQTGFCNRVKGYPRKIMCDLVGNGVCILTFPSNCNASVHNTELLSHCLNNGAIQTEESLITYPVETSILVLQRNNIVKFGIDSQGLFANGLDELILYGNRLASLDESAFNGLHDLSLLNLGVNYLTTLSNGVFSGLRKLVKLYLNGNKLASVQESVFNELISLTELRLYSNKLITLPNSLFRGLRNLDKLSLSSNQLATLDGDVFNELISLTYLSLNDNELTTLSSTAFRGLTNLDTLRLYNNQLATLSESVFNELNSLIHLDLTGNLLTTLPSGLFGQLGNMKRLYLYGNQLASLHGNTFNELTSLTDLMLQYNKLTTLPSGLFTGLSSLLRLHLHENQLTFLNDSLFNELTSLTDLWLQINKLTTLPSGLFRGLSVLNILDLGGNRLASLHESLFNELNSLGELWLHINELSTLPSTLFRGLRSLHSLNLNGNQLVSLNEHAFNELSSLSILRLNDNKLTILPSNLFRGQSNLDLLYLSGNQLATLDESVFNDLSLTDLYLSDNRLTTLPSSIFSGTRNIKYLFLNGNQLATLNENVFNELISLIILDLSENKLTVLPSTLFTGLTDLYWLLLNGNQLAFQNESIFNDLSSLSTLSLHDNKLTTLPSNLFRGLGNLRILNLYENQLITLHENVFSGLRSLTVLALNDNDLTTLQHGLLAKLGNLIQLYLYKNNIITLGAHAFSNLGNLEVLDMFQNKLMSLPNGIFNNITNLEYVFLQDNQLKSLSADLFQGLLSLNILNLSNNALTHIDFDIFEETLGITYLDLSQNRLKVCPNTKHLIQLGFLNLQGNILTAINHETFSSFPENSELAVSQHEICQCYVPAGVTCSASYKRSPYLTCDRLLSDKVLVVLMWLIGINALGGNLFVLIWRKMNTKKYKVQDLLLSNLAMSDSIMGFYMVIVASADIYYGEFFPMQSESWRTGITCRVAGALSIASTELSVFFLVLISIDRYAGIKYPYSDNKLGRRSTIVISAIVWVFSLSLGAVPSILSGRNFKFYDNSHVCIGLPLALTKTFSNYQNSTRIDVENLWFYHESYTAQYTGLVDGLYFSTAIFLGLNSICYLIILGCYIEIVRAVTKSAKQSGRTPDMKEQIRLTRKVSAIVLTDFMCIFPVIVLGILVQTRVVELPPSVYAWSVTFVLPINSAINPYLYTLEEIISNYRKKKMDRESQQETELTTAKSSA